jgi:hypothetical protein
MENFAFDESLNMDSSTPQLRGQHDEMPIDIDIETGDEVDIETGACVDIETSKKEEE